LPNVYLARTFGKRIKRKGGKERAKVREGGGLSEAREMLRKKEEGRERQYTTRLPKLLVEEGKQSIPKKGLSREEGASRRGCVDGTKARRVKGLRWGASQALSHRREGKKKERKGEERGDLKKAS